MTTKTADTAITIAPLQDVAALWWPDAPPAAIQRVSEPTRARIIAVLGRLYGDLPALRALDGDRITPDHRVVEKFLGTVLTALARGRDELVRSGLSAAITGYVGRYADVSADERREWLRVRAEFAALPFHHQQEFLAAVRDKLHDVSTNLAGYRAKVRAFDAWLARVEAWLGGGAKA